MDRRKGQKGRRKEAGQQARKEQYKIFWEGGRRPKAGQQARREQYKIF